MQASKSMLQPFQFYQRVIYRSHPEQKDHYSYISWWQRLLNYFLIAVSIWFVFCSLDSHASLPFLSRSHWQLHPSH